MRLQADSPHPIRADRRLGSRMLLGLILAFCGSGAGLPSLEAAPQDFILSQTDGSQVRGRPVQIQGRGVGRKLVFATGRVQLQVPFTKILGLRGLGPRVDSPVAVYLVGGTELKGKLQGGDQEGDTFHLASPLLGLLRPSTDRLDCMVFRAQAPLAGPEAFRIAAGADYDEALFRRAGRGFDVQGGALDHFAGGSVAFARSGEELARSYAYADLCALALRGGSPPERRRPQQLITRGGDCLRVALVGIDAQGCRFDTEFGALRLPLAGLAALDWLETPCRFLSDLEPVRVVERGSSDEASAPLYTWMRDRSVSRGVLFDKRSPGGGFLVVDGRCYGKGLGVHARSALTYKVPPGMTAFHALVGLDDEVKSLAVRGAVLVRVRLGAKTLFEKEITGARAPLNLGRLPVKAGDLLSLEVDFGKGLFLGDRLDWLQAVFLP